MKQVHTTERLLLRRWNDSDAELLYNLAKEPEVGNGAGWLPHSDEKYSLAVIRTILNADGEYAITFKDRPDEPVGSIGIRAGLSAKRGIDRADDAEIGYWIGKSFWNRGIATEALACLIRYGFCEEGLNRIWCGYFDGNDRSRRVMEKCSMTFHHRNEKLYNAMTKSYYNENMMVISMDDFRRLR